MCRQFAQQRLKKGAVIGGWVSSFYLLLPACLTPFLGIFIDVYGQRVTFCELSKPLKFGTSFERGCSVCIWSDVLDLNVAPKVLSHRSLFR